MIKHFFSILIFLFIFFFVFFIFSNYTSIKNKNKINLNRENKLFNVQENLSILPFLKNDTSDVIEFNSGYNNRVDKTERKAVGHYSF